MKALRVSALADLSTSAPLPLFLSLELAIYAYISGAVGGSNGSDASGLPAKSFAQQQLFTSPLLSCSVFENSESLSTCGLYYAFF